SQRAMPPYCRGSKHQKNGLAPLEERKRLCDPPNLPNLISFICLFPINMQPLTLFLRKEPGGLSSISPHPLGCGEAVDKEGSTAFFVEFGIKQFRRKVFICSGRTHPGN